MVLFLKSVDLVYSFSLFPSLSLFLAVLFLQILLFCFTVLCPLSVSVHFLSLPFCGYYAFFPFVVTPPFLFMDVGLSNFLFTNSSKF